MTVRRPVVSRFVTARPCRVLLTRYAAQSLYAPLRTLEAVPEVFTRSVITCPARITTLYPSAPLTVTPLAAWGAGGRTVVAIPKLTSTVSRKVVLDPMHCRFVTATFQHRWLGPAGTPEDTTTLYLVTEGRPRAFIAEPARRNATAVHKTGGSVRREVSRAD
ncbi:DUF3438 family protein [Escherichia coli]